jgi:hypothetical protein
MKNKPKTYWIEFDEETGEAKMFKDLFILEQKVKAAKRKEDKKWSDYYDRVAEANLFKYQFINYPPRRTLSGLYKAYITSLYVDLCIPEFFRANFCLFLCRMGFTKRQAGLMECMFRNHRLEFGLQEFRDVQ